MKKIKMGFKSKKRKKIVKINDVNKNILLVGTTGSGRKVHLLNLIEQKIKTKKSLIYFSFGEDEYFKKDFKEIVSKNNRLEDLYVLKLNKTKIHELICIKWEEFLFNDKILYINLPICEQDSVSLTSFILENIQKTISSQLGSDTKKHKIVYEKGKQNCTLILDEMNKYLIKSNYSVELILAQSRAVGLQTIITDQDMNDLFKDKFFSQRVIANCEIKIFLRIVEEKTKKRFKKEVELCKRKKKINIEKNRYGKGILIIDGKIKKVNRFFFIR